MLVMKTILICLGFLACLSLLADTVILKDGRQLEGKFVSATDENVVIDSGGIKMTINRSEIASIHFGGTVTAPATGPVPVTPAAAATPGPIPVATDHDLPAGTTFTVSIQTALASNQSQAGQSFSGVLVGDVRVGDQVVVPSGSPVTGQVVKAKRSGRGFRKTPAELDITLTTVTIDGKQVPVQTLHVNEQSHRERGALLRGAARGSAMGAIGGAIVDDGDAGEGAGAGAAIGAASGFLKKGDEIELPRGSVIAFTLQNGVKF